MRMWLCDPKIMCQKHLCGEHLEMHMFLGTLKSGKKIDGFIKNNLFQPDMLWCRHEDLKNEMIRRGYKHNSEIINKECDIIFNLSSEDIYWKMDREKALRDLLERCPECFFRYSNYI